MLPNDSFDESGESIIYLQTPNEETNMKLDDIKKLAEKSLRIPVEQQRLIYRGRPLVGNGTVASYNIKVFICSYKIEPGTTIHVIKRYGEFRDQPQNNPDPIPVISPVIIPGINLYEYGMGNIITSIVMTAAGCRRPERQSGDSTISPLATRFEEVRQSILTIETLISSIQNEKYQNLFKSPSPLEFLPPDSYQSTKNLQYYIGQWIDCLDSTQHWLEATIIDLNDDEVYVHFNGWSFIWDEWIHKRSHRIAPFRTKTLHTYLSSHYSPTPFCFHQNTPKYPPQPDIDTPESIFQILPSLVKRIIPSLEQLSSICHDYENGLECKMDENELKEFVNYISPMVDRVGRILVDLAPEISKYKLPSNNDKDNNNEVYHRLSRPPYISSTFDPSILPNDNIRPPPSTRNNRRRGSSFHQAQTPNRLSNLNPDSLLEDDIEDYMNSENNTPNHPHIDSIDDSVPLDEAFYGIINNPSTYDASILGQHGTISLTVRQINTIRNANGNNGNNGNNNNNNNNSYEPAVNTGNNNGNGNGNLEIDATGANFDDSDFTEESSSDDDDDNSLELHLQQQQRQQQRHRNNNNNNNQRTPPPSRSTIQHQQHEDNTPQLQKDNNKQQPSLQQLQRPVLQNQQRPPPPPPEPTLQQQQQQQQQQQKKKKKMMIMKNPPIIKAQSQQEVREVVPSSQIQRSQTQQHQQQPESSESLTVSIPPQQQQQQQQAVTKTPPQIKRILNEDIEKSHSDTTSNKSNMQYPPPSYPSTPNKHINAPNAKTPLSSSQQQFKQYLKEHSKTPPQQYRSMRTSTPQPNKITQYLSDSSKSRSQTPKYVNNNNVHHQRQRSLMSGLDEMNRSNNSDIKRRSNRRFSLEENQDYRSILSNYQDTLNQINITDDDDNNHNTNNTSPPLVLPTQLPPPPPQSSQQQQQQQQSTTTSTTSTTSTNSSDGSIHSIATAPPVSSRSQHNRVQHTIHARPLVNLNNRSNNHTRNRPPRIHLSARTPNSGSDSDNGFDDLLESASP